MQERLRCATWSITSKEHLSGKQKKYLINCDAPFGTWFASYIFRKLMRSSNSNFGVLGWLHHKKRLVELSVWSHMSSTVIPSPWWSRNNPRLHNHPEGYQIILDLLDHSSRPSSRFPDLLDHLYNHFSSQDYKLALSKLSRVKWGIASACRQNVSPLAVGCGFFFFFLEAIRTQMFQNIFPFTKQSVV